MRFRKFPSAINRPNDLVSLGFEWHNIIALLSEKSGPNCHDLALKGFNTNMDDSGTSELLSLQVPENTQEYDQSDEWGAVSPVVGYCVEAVSVNLWPGVEKLQSWRFNLASVLMNKPQLFYKQNPPVLYYNGILDGIVTSPTVGVGTPVTVWLILWPSIPYRVTCIFIH